MMECGICNEVFNEEERKPLGLPCLHSFCIHESLQCPVCRGNFQACSSEDIPVNRGMLDMMIHMKQMERGQPAIVKPYEGWQLPQGENKAELHKIKVEMEKLIRIDEILIKEIQKFNVVAKDFVQDNENLVENLTENKEKLQNQMDYFTEKYKEMSDAETKIKSANNFLAAAPIVAAVSEIMKELQETACNTKLIIDGNHALLRTIEENNRESQKKLNCIKDIQNSLKDFDVDATVDGHPEIWGLTSKDEPLVYLSIEEMKVATGELYSVTSVNGKWRFLRVIKDEIDSKKFYIPSHKEGQVISPSAQLVKHECLLNLKYPYYPEAYMDLSHNGKLLGRIVIDYVNTDHYSDNINNHIQLCSGESGPSYANSKIIKVEKMSSREESIVLGDYENHDGTGGKAVLKTSPWWNKKHSHSLHEPYHYVYSYPVCPYDSEEATASQFRIQRKGTEYCFGRVSLGYDILTTAFQKYNIKELEIQDCGLILELE